MKIPSLSTAAPLLALALFATAAEAQLQYGGRPHPAAEQRALRSEATVELPAFDVDALLEEDVRRGTGEVFRFGKVHEVSLTTADAGMWQDLEDGARLWRLRLRSAGAHSLSLLFSQFDLTPGMELFVYDDERAVVRGAYTHLSNKPNGQFAIQPTPGEALTLELYVPPGASTGARGRLRLAGVVHDYAGAFKADAPEGTGETGGSARGSCNVNVACPEATPWPDQVNTTVRVQIGGGLCSGALINNTRRDGDQLLMSASHCGSLDNAIFFFNYQTSDCTFGTFPDGYTVQGSTLLSADAALDHRLVRITETIPPTFRAYYAGWNRGSVPPTSSFSIHHPNGDPKKISIDDDPCIRPAMFPTFWRVRDWDVGSTAAGSSGSPLFDQDGLYVGHLCCGTSACGNNGNDNYGALDSDWPMLAPFLDPLGTGEMAIEGIDPDGPTPGPVLSAVVPPTVEALDPGTAQTVTLQGDFFTPLSTITVNGQTVFNDYSFADINTLTIDLPEVASLGTHTIEVTTEAGTTSTTFDVVPAAEPTLQVGNGDDPQFNTVPTFFGLRVKMSGTPGDMLYLLASSANTPSVVPGVQLDIGMGFTDIIRLGIHTIPSDSALVDLNIPLVPALGGMVFYFQALNLDFPLPLTVSNLQGVTLF